MQARAGQAPLQAALTRRAEGSRGDRASIGSGTAGLCDGRGERSLDGWPATRAILSSCRPTLMMMSCIGGKRKAGQVGIPIPSAPLGSSPGPGCWATCRATRCRPRRPEARSGRTRSPCPRPVIRSRPGGARPQDRRPARWPSGSAPEPKVEAAAANPWDLDRDKLARGCKHLPLGRRSCRPRPWPGSRPFQSPRTAAKSPPQTTWQRRRPRARRDRCARWPGMRPRARPSRGPSG